MMVGTALIAVLLTGQVLPAKWQRQALTPIYSVETPVALKQIVANAASKTMPKGMKYWLGKYESAAYSAMLMPVTDADRKLATPPLDAFSKGMARPNDGIITWRRVLSLPGGLKGLEWDQENRFMKSRWRAYGVKKTILAAAVSWKAKAIPPTRMNRYLDSMRIRP